MKPTGKPLRPEQSAAPHDDLRRQGGYQGLRALLLGAFGGRQGGARRPSPGAQGEAPPGPDARATSRRRIDDEAPAAGEAPDGEVPAGGEALPHLSTVLGPLPETVTGEQTRDLNDAVHQILIAGLVLSTVLLVIGLILDAINGRSLPVQTVPPMEALNRALQLRGSGFLSLGLLVLIFTPIVRVIGSVIVFLSERDWRYVAITIFVLIVMLTSVLLGRS